MYRAWELTQSFDGVGPIHSCKDALSATFLMIKAAMRWTMPLLTLEVYTNEQMANLFDCVCRVWQAFAIVYVVYGDFFVIVYVVNHDLPCQGAK